MTQALSATERAMLDRAHRQRYKLARAPRYSPLPAADTSPGDAGEASAQKTSARQLVTLPRPPFAVRVLNNLSYGATTASVAEFNALGGNDLARLTAWVDRQLNPSAIDDSAVESRLTAAGYTTLGKTLQQLWSQHVRQDDYNTRMRPGWEVQRAAFVRAVFSKRQLFEVVNTFWHDHFNVMLNDYDCAPVYGHYDRDVIRANAFGNFRTMLEAVAQSNAMMHYLDNKSNRRAGPNENFARELLELHTFGAENYLGFMDPFQVPPCPEDPSYPLGYTDIDVYETASAFTGWTIKNGHWEYPNDNDGTFVYRSEWHDSGPKFVLGTFIYPERPALQDGRDILNRIASHPRVAKFICRKLIRRFIADDPHPALVESAAQVFRANWQAPDQIKRTLRHILLSEDLQYAWGRKNRRPFDAVVAGLRVLDCDWTYRIDENRSNDLNWRMGFTGHQPYDWPAPNGYPDTSVAWSGASSFGMTWKVLNWLTETNNVADNGKLLPLLDTTRAGLPAGQWTANRLVEFWCNRILGYQPAPERLAALRGFMAQNGDPATYVIEDTDNWAQNDLKRHYNQQRLRSMVSLILMSPEFLSR
ncbi:MAG: DUF1800 domain-containing protein [Proteobacteria bacterium]|nr:DUF1800 domain-containing protein [Pseudomonadota bacterium]